MTPKPVYCADCGGFTGRYATTEGDAPAPVGSHLSHSECLQFMNARLCRIEDAITEELRAVRKSIDGLACGQG